ncbi:hypothetical protein BC829DRAFT_246441 [Chytridium lagenaria]|nr:hypothetical protein BC829DRAFT_246441 [Chytridium lagenaria]
METIQKESMEELYWRHPDSLEKLVCARLLLSKFDVVEGVDGVMMEMKQKGIEFYDALEILFIMCAVASPLPDAFISGTSTFIQPLINTPFEATLWSMHPCLLAIISSFDARFQDHYLSRLSSETWKRLSMLFLGDDVTEDQRTHRISQTQMALSPFIPTTTDLRKATQALRATIIQRSPTNPTQLHTLVMEHHFHLLPYP